MPREMFGTRLNESGAKVVRGLAEKYGTTQSTVIRVMLGETVRNTTTMNAVKTRLEAMRDQ
jgi:type IV pilus biogenesis protein CpaD/CtpE